MFLIITACFLLQTTLLQKLKLANVTPDLLVVLVSAAGFMYGRGHGMFAGVLCGVLCDLLYSNIIGMYILIYTVTGYVNGALLHKIYYKDDMIIPVLAIAASDFSASLSFYVFNFLLRGRLDILVYIKNVILPELVYTVFAGVIIYKLLHKLEGKMYPVEEVPLEAGSQAGQEDNI